MAMVAINNDGPSICAGCRFTAPVSHNGGKLMFKPGVPVGDPRQVPPTRGMRMEEMFRWAGEIAAGRISRAEIEKTWPGPLAMVVLQLAHEIDVAARRESRTTAQFRTAVIAGAVVMAGLIAATIIAILRGLGS